MKRRVSKPLHEIYYKVTSRTGREFIARNISSDGLILVDFMTYPGVKRTSMENYRDIESLHKLQLDNPIVKRYKDYLRID